MSELLFFVLGVMLGGLIMLVTLCGLQMHRVRQYEAEIQRLRQRRGFSMRKLWSGRSEIW